MEYPDDLSEVEEEDEDENSDLDEDEKRIAEEKAYRRFLPQVKEQVKEVCGDERPNLLADKLEKACLVCPTFQCFKGWTALLAHAASFKKKRPHQHRGYHRALTEALRVNEPSPSQSQSEGAAPAPSFLIVWPPIVIVEPAHMDPAKTITTLLSEATRDLHVAQTLEVPSSRHSSHKWILVFEGSVMGYFQACELRDRLKKERGAKLHGYLAEPRHMETLDPHKRLVPQWSLEDHQEKVKGAQRKSKQEHDMQQAKLKAIELEVENLTEDERKFKMNKDHMEYLIKKMQKEIEEHEKRRREMELRFQDAMRNMDDKFRMEMKNFDARSHARVKRLRDELENSEKRLEEARFLSKKEVEKLEHQFLALTEDHRKQEAQKALQREHEAMRKRRNFTLEMEKAEAEFNERARQQESELQEQQEKEMMALMEDAKREREKLLVEYLEEQKALKQKGMEAKQAEHPSNECAVCWDALNKDNRALLKPCGHANVCMECAQDIYQNTRLCPMCRQEIGVPTLLPEKLYM